MGLSSLNSPSSPSSCSRITAARFLSTVCCARHVHPSPLGLCLLLHFCYWLHYILSITSPPRLPCRHRSTRIHCAPIGVLHTPRYFCLGVLLCSAHSRHSHHIWTIVHFKLFACSDSIYTSRFHTSLMVFSFLWLHTNKSSTKHVVSYS